MNNLCIIPARGGSKRIPDKNIRLFKGKPIIAYSIELAIKSKLFSEVMVSTDSKIIAEISKNYNAAIPFFRSSETSDDFCGLSDVIVEVLNKYRDQGKFFDNICCILATAPLITLSNLNNAYKMLINSQFDTIYPIVEFSYPVQRAVVLNHNKKINMKWPEHINSRSQDLEKLFHDSGSFYWIKYDEILNKGSFERLSCGGYIIDSIMSQDIDNYSDWALAEYKYDIINNCFNDNKNYNRRK